MSIGFYSCKQSVITRVAQSAFFVRGCIDATTGVRDRLSLVLVLRYMPVNTVLKRSDIYYKRK